MYRGYHNLDSFLSAHERFLISTHESPDGDGLGAEIAFNELLGKLGKKSSILNSDPLPEKYKFMDPDGEIGVFDPAESLPPDIGDYVLFVLDTNDMSNIGASYRVLSPLVRDVFVIDHHEGGRDLLESNFIKVEASSASEIVYSFFQYYNRVPSFKAAQALYTGILFDTGSFRYPKTSPETFKIISHLVELGANPFSIYEHIYENNELSSFLLRAKILSTAEVHYDGKLIMMTLTPEMIRVSGSTFPEGELSINMPLTIKGVIASVLVKQDVEGPVKVSMRTKGDYNVAEIALKNGGGGHKNAAGYKSTLSLEDTRQKVLGEVGAFFESGSPAAPRS
ncbi:MAG: bifunctional oligoribonuclease/PAP phosphatase NrnA [Spirochaetes bacterium]|nr:MAG: bifunctional oligoribonuclease/PAP phosphatase NrnA [Spirochaetota bacterium]